MFVRLPPAIEQVIHIPGRAHVQPRGNPAHRLRRLRPHASPPRLCRVPFGTPASSASVQRRRWAGPRGKGKMPRQEGGVPWPSSRPVLKSRMPSSMPPLLGGTGAGCSRAHPEAVQDSSTRCSIGGASSGQTKLLTPRPARSTTMRMLHQLDRREFISRVSSPASLPSCRVGRRRPPAFAGASAKP